MKRLLHILLPMLMTVFVFPSFAQVSEIRSASAGSAKGGDSGGSQSSSGAIFFDVLIHSFGLMGEWQRMRLENRQNHPSMVSLDIIAAGAVQPSSYYILNPRVRGNWGLFSTDFRTNHIIEEGVEGVEAIHTVDWQIVQLNIVGNPAVNFYVGGGFISESFGGRNTYAEYTTGLNVLPRQLPVGFAAELRVSDPRLEVSTHVRRKLAERNRTVLSLTAGLMWQQYYTQDLWGLQGGIMLTLR